VVLKIISELRMQDSSFVLVFFVTVISLALCQFYPSLSAYKDQNRRSRYQQSYSNNALKSFYSPYRILPTTTTTTKRPSAIKAYTDTCGLRHSSYRADQRSRRGKIIWTDQASAGARAAPDGSFPWMASLFLRRDTGEAYFMCAATILSPRVLVSAAHCFSDKYNDEDWFVRVGDNYIVSKDPSEQTFQVNLIVKHEHFYALSSPGGDGRHDVALLHIKTRKGGKGIQFDKYVRPACLPHQGEILSRWSSQHCEIAGWGMQEYNNTESYPDSVRAAKIKLGLVDDTDCNYLYGRDVKATGKFCAGGNVDACQEDSGGPLVCSVHGRYQVVGIVSSGKGCGTYPGLYTEVSKYTSWILRVMDRLENEVQ